MIPYVETYKGHKFEFLCPKPETIDIEDIAHALAMQCRYTGHCREFYSVAEHSVYVARLCPPHLAFTGLMHDASEAYLTDIASPVKPFLENYFKLEDNLMGVLAERFGFIYPFPKEVHTADITQLMAEAENLLPSKGEGWGNDAFRGKGYKPACYSPKHAEEMFLAEFERLFYVENTQAAVG